MHAAKHQPSTPGLGGLWQTGVLGSSELNTERPFGVLKLQPLWCSELRSPRDGGQTSPSREITSDLALC
jgi:hypothetical protein